MTISEAIFEAQEFIKLAEAFRDEHRDLIESNKKHWTYKMKSRAKMKRSSLKLSEALIEVRKMTAY
jgi:hypothetical protein